MRVLQQYLEVPQAVLWKIENNTPRQHGLELRENTPCHVG